MPEFDTDRELLEKDTFIECVMEQLQKMSEAQKDAWILTKAKLLPESERRDFLMSLNGEKIVIYMPAEAEIERFCEKVRNGDIYVEYETHYYEFNSEGRYVDDWEVHHNDPQNAFHFLNRTFTGCHDLIQLGEYDLAGRILDQICTLEFQVMEAEDSEDFEDDSPFTITDAGREQLLVMDTREIGYDWILALFKGRGDHENVEFARKLADILKLELCRKLQLSDFYEYVTEKFLDIMEVLLEGEIKEIRRDLEQIQDRRMQWRTVHMLEEKMTRNQHLLLDIRKKCRMQGKTDEMPKQVPVLQASWNQIRELFQILSYERYIDDQLEIDEVWNICEVLVKRDRFAEEDWKIRKKILKDIVSHEYYDRYGCCDPIQKLAEKLYITDAEVLEFADILNEHGYYAREAADLYRQYGRRDRYIQYLETHLDRSSKEYLELIQCYCKDGNEAGARETAEQGLGKCKDDLTELFIFLLKDADKNGDKEKYKKLYASAKRRKMADIVRVDEAMREWNSSERER